MIVIVIKKFDKITTCLMSYTMCMVIRSALMMFSSHDVHDTTALSSELDLMLVKCSLTIMSNRALIVGRPP